MEANSPEETPGIFIIGPPNVGKRTLLSRLLSVDFEDCSESSSEIIAHGWTINTKYYAADVSVWMTHLHDGFSVSNLPMYDSLVALVMVFDMNDLSSLATLKDWVSRTDIQKFEILLCIGNKVDLLPGHPAHAEYRRRLQKLGDSSADPHSEFTEYGLTENEGISLLGDEEPSWEIGRSCLEWCSEHGIEYIEACASNVDFDKCLSVDGDSQGLERLFGALSAHMWPGMILKSGDKIAKPTLPDNPELLEGESDYEFDYEILSAGSAEPWDDTYGGWVSANGTATPHMKDSVSQTGSVTECNAENGTRCDIELQPTTSMASLGDESDKVVVPPPEGSDRTRETDEGNHFGFEDLEQLMSEIGNMRDSLRLMPDFQRRDMAAKLALKMASMFGGSSDDEREI